MADAEAQAGSSASRWPQRQARRAGTWEERCGSAGEPWSRKQLHAVYTGLMAYGYEPYAMLEVRHLGRPVCGIALECVQHPRVQPER